MLMLIKSGYLNIKKNTLTLFICTYKVSMNCSIVEMLETEREPGKTEVDK